MSDFQTVKESVTLKDYAESNLDRVRGGYVCPACGSGTGPSKTPALSIKGETWTCFSCNNHGDVFDLAAHVEGLDALDRRGQLQAVASWANIPLSIDFEPTRATARTTPAPKAPEKPKPDYSEGQARERGYIERCKANAHAPEAVAYLTARGFTESEVDRFGFGFDPHSKNGWKDESGTWHNGPRVVIPWIGCDYYHIDRALGEGIASVKYYKPNSDQVGPQPLFNPAALEGEGPVFLVEGPMDALAIMACGFDAVALMGTDNRENLAQIVQARPELVAVAMDTDGPGREAQQQILTTLKDNQIAVSSIDWGNYKDAGEWLERDREGLRAFLAAACDRAQQDYQEQQRERLESVLESFKVRNPADVATDIFLGGYHEDPLPTGIKGLDVTLNGGLRTGLYILGAISSLGKTTLALQIADAIAASGRPVLFVTIEQSAGELVAKSLNRIIFELTGELFPTWRILGDAEQRTLEELQTLENACEEYRRTVSESLHIMEGSKQPSADDVRNAAELMAFHLGKSPAVFIDYLQLMAPQSDRDSDKQAVDKNVMALRQLARDIKAPVFAISSLNRSSYSEGVGLESFKESGAIEYGADVLLGLQAQKMEDVVDMSKDGAVKKTVKKFMRKFKAKESRPCELLVLKNRNGKTDEEGIKLRFETRASRFLED